MKIPAVWLVIVLAFFIAMVSPQYYLDPKVVPIMVIIGAIMGIMIVNLVGLQFERKIFKK